MGAISGPSFPEFLDMFELLFGRPMCSWLCLLTDQWTKDVPLYLSTLGRMHLTRGGYEFLQCLEPTSLGTCLYGR